MIEQKPLVTQIELFDLLNIFLTDKVAYANIVHSAKAKHLFMLQRFLAIRYPVKMHELGRNFTVSCLDALHHELCKPGKPPQWIYTSTKKEVVEKRLSISGISTETLYMFMRVNDVDLKSIYWLVEHGDEKIVKELEDLEKDMASPKNALQKDKATKSKSKK